MIGSFSDTHYTKPTTDFWQEILPADHPKGEATPPFRFGYPARLPDRRILELPLRTLPNGERAVASLIANQASISVTRELSVFMADSARSAGAEVIVGMPTLGLVFAPQIAERLGQPNYVPLGYSRKFWYRDELSEPVHSITSPERNKSVFIDPNMLARLAGRRVAVVDDAISSGATLVSVMALLARLDCTVSAIIVAMAQGTGWRGRLAQADPAMPDLVRWTFAAPLFERIDSGWAPIPDSMAG